jgi:hypothetical protein
VSLKAKLLVALISTTSFAAPAQSLPDVEGPSSAKVAGPQMDSAPIEEVIEANDQGFRFDAYIVRWHGARVLISDPLGVCHLSMGDSIHFIVAHTDIGDRHLLSFMSTERPERRGEAASAPPQPTGTAQTGTALVEEVLSASDGAYRFTAYIAQWQGKRIAIPDLIGGTHLPVGTEARIVATHASVMGYQVLQFMNPIGANSGGTASPVSRSVSHDVGTIEQVLKGTSGGYSYATYIVLWHGVHVALESEGMGSLQQPGETAPLTVSRSDVPIGPGKGLLQFALDTHQEPAASQGEGGANFSTSTSATEGVVDRVLDTQVDGYRYRAYVVTWHGSHVVVEDMFATTHYKSGDQISFMMGRVTSGGERRIIFAVFQPQLPSAEKTATPH